MPEDDALRAAALRIAEDRSAVLHATRVRARTTVGVLLALAVVLAVVRSPWWWIAVAACGALVVLVLAAPARVRRRAEALRRAGR